MSSLVSKRSAFGRAPNEPPPTQRVEPDTSMFARRSVRPPPPSRVVSYVNDTDTGATGIGTLYGLQGGATYHGEVRNNEPHGFGTCTYPPSLGYNFGKPSVYTGNWVSGKRHGKGTLYYHLDNGESRVCVGTWVEGEKHGEFHEAPAARHLLQMSPSAREAMQDLSPAQTTIYKPGKLEQWRRGRRVWASGDMAVLPT